MAAEAHSSCDDAGPRQRQRGELARKEQDVLEAQHLTRSNAFGSLSIAVTCSGVSLSRWSARRFT